VRPCYSDFHAAPAQAWRGAAPPSSWPTPPCAKPVSTVSSVWQLCRVVPAGRQRQPRPPTFSTQILRPIAARPGIRASDSWPRNSRIVTVRADCQRLLKPRRPLARARPAQDAACGSTGRLPLAALLPSDQGLRRAGRQGCARLVCSPSGVERGERAAVKRDQYPLTPRGPRARAREKIASVWVTPADWDAFSMRRRHLRPDRIKNSRP
jgi:hypothetical protein